MQTSGEAKLAVHEISEAEFRRRVPEGRTNIHPAHWPDDVRAISLEGLGFIGLDSKGQMYLDGERLYTERRLARQERILAWLVVIAAWVAAGAASASAYADIAC